MPSCASAKSALASSAERDGDTLIGRDTVQTQDSFDPSGLPRVENVTLAGANNATAVGNASANGLTGNAKRNILIGEGTRDALAVGGDKACDVIAFDDASQSTRRPHGLVTGFDAAGGDRLIVADAAVGLLRFSGAARLDAGRLDADVAAEVDAFLTRGGAIRAVIFTPNAGDLAGTGEHAVGDADSDGSCRAGEDDLVQLTGRAGNLDLGDVLWALRPARDGRGRIRPRGPSPAPPGWRHEASIP